MARHLAWLLPALFVTIAIVYAIGGRMDVAVLYALLALGVGLHARGVRNGVAPMQWFGAGIAGFVLVILLWMAFAG